MVFAVAGGGQLDTGGYQIDNSLRFNEADQPRLSRTPGSTSGDQTFTLSFWVKRNAVEDSKDIVLFEARPAAGTYFILSFRRSSVGDKDRFYIEANTSTDLTFAPLFRDVSAWYHIVVAIDTTQGTSTNRVKFYVNGSQVTDLGGVTTYPALNESFQWNKNVIQSIASSFDPTNLGSDYQLAEVHNISGQQLSPTDFGEFDADSGIWKPIQYSGSYGTNGFYLDFEDSGSLGADQSGNGNNFTPTNLASTDQMLDTPTNNFATGNPLMTNYWIRTLGVATGSQGNLEWSIGASDKKVGATISTAGGKWYAEMRVNSLGSISALVSGYDANEFEIGYNQAGNRQFNRATPVSYGASFGAGDVIGFAVDQDNNQVTFYKNGASQGTLTNTFVGDAFFIGAFIYNGNVTFNFGQDSTFAGRETAASNTDENGYGEFHHSVPSGYLALCTQNLATELSPTIDDGSEYFQTALYSGTNSSNAITNDGNSDLQPDWLWIKERSSTSGHILIDSSRGITKSLESHDTAAESTSLTKLLSINSDGFTVGNDNGTNESGQTYVAWQWKVNAGTTSSNTDGSITTTVQANQDAGISILTYVGTQANATIGHGLSKAPEVMIAKVRNEGTYGWGGNWWPYKNTGQFQINIANPYYENVVYWQNTDPSNTVITMGGQVEANRSGKNMVAYCFHSVEGFSKMGVYTGNGSTDGAFVYTGFRPAYVMIKYANGTGNWFIFDNKRTPFNLSDDFLEANDSAAESTNNPNHRIDILSNAFKLRGSGSASNASGGKYIYMAFAENPFVSSTGVAGTAK